METQPGFDSKHFTDEEVVLKALQNMDMFEVIVERYEKKLLRYVHRISAFSPEEAEEILQEIFIKAWKNLNGFSTKLKFSSWIYRIAHNQTIDHFRKATARGDTESIQISEELYLPTKDDLKKELDVKMSADAIAKVLAAMPEKYREVLVLHFLEDKDYLEICDILKCPKGTVAIRMSRAKKIFRETAQNLNIRF